MTDLHEALDRLLRILALVRDGRLAWGEVVRELYGGFPRLVRDLLREFRMRLRSARGKGIDIGRDVGQRIADNQ